MKQGKLIKKIQTRLSQQLCLSVCAFALFTGTHPLQAQEHTIVEGLAHFNAGKMDAAVPAFEGVFSDSSSVEKRLQSALFLAYAPSSLLKKHKRHFYADYYLSHASKISDQSRNSLLRIVGDGLFDEMKLESSLQTFTQLAKSSDIKIQAYAQYKMGWIELNQKRPDLTVNRWISFLSLSSAKLISQDPDLHHAIIRDLGKSWVECFETSGEGLSKPPVSLQASELLQVVKNTESLFIEGLALGMKRLSQPEIVEKVRVELYQSRFAKSTFDQLMKKGFVFNALPCEFPLWVNSPIQLSDIDKSQALPFLNACARILVKKKTLASPSGIALQSLFNQFNLVGDELLPRITLAVETKRWDHACGDLLKLAKNKAETQVALTEVNRDTLYETCSHSFANAKAPENFSDFQSLVTFYAERKNYPSTPPSSNPDAISKLMGIALNHPAFAKAMSEQLLKQPEKFQQTALPEMVAARLQSSLPEALLLLNTYGKPPVKGIWLQLLKSQVKASIQNKDLAKAWQLLDQFLPIRADMPQTGIAAIAQQEEASSLWQYYWFSLNETETATQSATVSLWFDHVGITQLSREDKERTFALLLKYGLLKQIWSGWEQFGMPHSDLTSAFFERTLSALQDNTLAPEAVQNVASGRVLLKLIAHDSSLTSQNIQAALGKNFSTPFMQDLKNQDALKALSKNLNKQTLKLDSSLSRVLGRKLKLIAEEEALAAPTVWVSTQLAQWAESLFKNDCQTVVNALDELDQTLKDQPDLGEIRTQIHQIRDQIAEKTAGGLKK